MAEAKPPTLTLVKQEPVPKAKPPVRPMVAPLVAKTPVPAPDIKQPSPVTTLAAKPEAHAPAPEINPNAHVAVLPPEAALSPTPPPNLDGAKGIVFVLDISGSMYEPCDGTTRIACARKALALRIRELKNGTPFAIVLYAQQACASGPLVAASDVTRDAAVRFIMRDVDCGGGTNLPAGLAAATQLRTGSLVLVTDGDLNMSPYNLLPRVRDLLGSPGQGPTLTVLGIAPRLSTANDRLLQSIADQQDGSYQLEQLDSEPSLLTSTASPTKPATATP